MAKTMIGALSVRLSAQTAAFSKGLQTASKRTRAFRQSLGKVGLAIAAFGTAAASAATYAITRLTRAQMSAIDTMAKLSDITGTTTQDIAALRFAGQLAGASTEKVDKALKNFVRRIGEAKTGTGEAVDGLNALGLSADRLSRMGTADALTLVSEKLNTLPTAADKAEAAYSLLGRSGLDMMNLLLAGGSAIDDARKKTLAFGTAIDRGAAAKVEAANDAMTTLAEVFKGVGTTIAVKVAPFVLALADKFTELSQKSGKLKAALNGIGAGAVEYVALFLDGLQMASNYVLRFGDVFLNVIHKITTAWSKFLRLASMVDPGGLSRVAIAATDNFIDFLDKQRSAHQTMQDLFAGESLGIRFKRGLKDIQNNANAIAESMMEAAKARAELSAAGEMIGEREGLGNNDRFRQISLSRTAIGGPGRQESMLQKLVDNTQVIINNTRMMGVR